jgi:hypothetical protein
MEHLSAHESCTAPDCGVDMLERVEFLGYTENGIAFPVVLHDKPHTDPMAVHMELRVHPTRSIAWVFSRHLLIEGMHQQTGDGDVQIAPDAEFVSVGLLGTTSAGKESRSSVFLPRNVVQRYLTNTATHDEPWRGRRSDELIDELLATLAV